MVTAWGLERGVAGGGEEKTFPSEQHILFQSLNLLNQYKTNPSKNKEKLFFCLGKKTIIISTVICTTRQSQSSTLYLGKYLKFSFKICDAPEKHDFTVLQPPFTPAITCDKDT